MSRSNIAWPRFAAAAGVLALSLAAAVASAASSPWSGTAIAIPNIIQAENFDRGGERVAYHDLTAANTGGKYRPKESVDIMTSPEPGGGYIVSNLDTGEWLVYSIQAATAGYYDVELRVSSAVPNSAYHIEIDGQPVTDMITVPNTGSWNTYQWVGKRRVYVAAGRHRLTVGSDQQYFGFDAIRVTRSTAWPTPWSGTPGAIPGTIEAEHYDRGGEGLAYHDLSPGNIGGQYRGEDVDIMASPDAATGGFIVSHLDTGEWLVYSIQAATTGYYDIELRASSAMQGSAYHLEIDSQPVTDVITVPDTGGWDSYQWVGKRRVHITAGRHVLTVGSDQQYFGFDAIRISASARAADALSGSSARQLFGSSFEGGALSIAAPLDCWGTGCWQDFAGLDPSGFRWPGNLWGGGGKFLILTDPVTTTPQNIGNYAFNRIEPAGRSGGQALYQQITQNVNGTASQGASPAQNEFQFLPQRETGDVYMSYWIRLQPDLVQKMNNLPAGPGVSGGGTWRAFFAFKTGGQTSWGGPADNGDYRVAVNVLTYGGGQPYWHVLGDNNAGGGAPLVNNWNVENRNVPVPVGEWFKFEIFWHRSGGADGRIWVAANGQVIADRRGPNVGAWNLPINRIMAPMVYSGSAMPIYQWVDDLEVWDGFPPPNGANPPYAAR